MAANRYLAVCAFCAFCALCGVPEEELGPIELLDGLLYIEGSSGLNLRIFAAISLLDDCAEEAAILRA